MTIQACASYLLTPDDSSGVSTGAAQEDSLACDDTQRAVNRELWDKVIDDHLIEWGRHPERLEEDDLIPPTAQAIQVAGRLAQKLRDSGALPPKRVVPDRDGGLALERWEGEHTVTIMVSANGAVEILQWHGSRIVASGQFD